MWFLISPFSCHLRVLRLFLPPTINVTNTFHRGPFAPKRRPSLKEFWKKDFCCLLSWWIKQTPLPFFLTFGFKNIYTFIRVISFFFSFLFKTPNIRKVEIKPPELELLIGKRPNPDFKWFADNILVSRAPHLKPACVLTAESTRDILGNIWVPGQRSKSSRGGNGCPLHRVCACVRVCEWVRVCVVTVFSLDYTSYFFLKKPSWFKLVSLFECVCVCCLHVISKHTHTHTHLHWFKHYNGWLHIFIMPRESVFQNVWHKYEMRV